MISIPKDSLIPRILGFRFDLAIHNDDIKVLFKIKRYIYCALNGWSNQNKEPNIMDRNELWRIEIMIQANLKKQRGNNGVLSGWCRKFLTWTAHLPILSPPIYMHT